MNLIMQYIVAVGSLVLFLLFFDKDNMYIGGLVVGFWLFFMGIVTMLLSVFINSIDSWFGFIILIIGIVLSHFSFLELIDRLMNRKK